MLADEFHTVTTVNIQNYQIYILCSVSTFTIMWNCGDVYSVHGDGREWLSVSVPAGRHLVCWKISVSITISINRMRSFQLQISVIIIIGVWLVQVRWLVQWCQRAARLMYSVRDWMMQDLRGIHRLLLQGYSRQVQWDLLLFVLIICIHQRPPRNVFPIARLRFWGPFFFTLFLILFREGKFVQKASFF